MGGILFLVLIGVIAYYALKSGSCPICKGAIDKATAGSVPNFSHLTTIERPHRDIHGLICATCKAEVDKTSILYHEAVDRADKMESWPATYKGKVPVVPGSEKLSVSSDHIKGKDNARRQLFVIAAYLNPECNAIIDLKFATMGAADGNYQYTVRQATGKPCVIK